MFENAAGAIFKILTPLTISAKLKLERANVYSYAVACKIAFLSSRGKRVGG